MNDGRANYHTITAPLVLQQEHPFQPQHHLACHEYSSVPYHLSIKKVVEQMSIRDEPRWKAESFRRQQAAKNMHMQFISHFQSRQERYSTVHLENEAQLQNIHPQQGQLKHQYSQNQSLHTKTVSIHQPKEENTDTSPCEDNHLKWNQIIVSSALVPQREENYFENAGGFIDSAYSTDKNNLGSALPSLKYPWIFSANLILAMFIFLSLQINQVILWMFCLGVAIIYLLLVLRSSLGETLTNLQEAGEFQFTLNYLKQQKGYFMFHIQCFHYANDDSEGQLKLVSSKKSEIYTPEQSNDESCDLSQLEIKTKYAAIKAKKLFCFQDKNSEGKFILAFNQFVSKNLQDLHQKYYFTFEVDAPKREKAKLVQKPNFVKMVFIIFCLLGLAYPFALLVECQITRIEAKLRKRLRL